MLKTICAATFPEDFLKVNFQQGGLPLPPPTIRRITKGQSSVMFEAYTVDFILGPWKIF